MGKCNFIKVTINASLLKHLTKTMECVPKCVAEVTFTEKWDL